MIDLDPAQWFDPLGACQCGKPAHGIVRNQRNAPIAYCCTRCGEARVKKALRQRECAKANPWQP